MDERKDMARILDRLDKIEGSLGHLKSLLLLAVGLLLLGLATIAPVVADLFYLLMCGATLVGGGYVGWWSLKMLVKLRTRRCHEGEPRGAVPDRSPTGNQ